MVLGTSWTNVSKSWLIEDLTNLVIPLHQMKEVSNNDLKDAGHILQIQSRFCAGTQKTDRASDGDRK